MDVDNSSGDHHVGNQPNQPKMSEVERRIIRERHLKRETYKIVESLLEGKHDEEYFIRCVSLLCKNDFDDVNTERYLASFCGYPLCGANVEQVTPKQQFKIDLRNKQIYKMSDRIQFCSVLCFKSSYYVREQMSELPLWMRYRDEGGYEELYRRGFAHFKLYQQEPIIKDLKVVEQEWEEEMKAEDEENLNEASAKLKEVSIKETVSFPYIKKEHLEQLQNNMTGLVIKEKNYVDEVPNESCPIKSTESDFDGRLEESRPSNRNESIKSEELSCDSEMNDQKKTDEEEDEVFTKFQEWITFDTLLLIFGKSIIDELLDQSSVKNTLCPGVKVEESEEKKLQKLENQVSELCKKLDEEEILENLIHETEKLELLKQDNDTKRKFETNPELKKRQKRKVTFDPQVTASSPPTAVDTLTISMLPPISSKSQIKLRKQLFCRQIQKTLNSSKISDTVINQINPFIRDMVDTFKFTPQNVIVRKSSNWPKLLLYFIQIHDVYSKSTVGSEQFTKLMDEKSVIDLQQRSFPDGTYPLDRNISALLNYHKY